MSSVQSAIMTSSLINLTPPPPQSMRRENLAFFSPFLEPRTSRWGITGSLICRHFVCFWLGIMGKFPATVSASLLGREYRTTVRGGEAKQLASGIFCWMFSVLRAACLDFHTDIQGNKNTVAVLLSRKDPISSFVSISVFSRK